MEIMRINETIENKIECQSPFCGCNTARVLTTDSPKELMSIKQSVLINEMY